MNRDKFITKELAKENPVIRLAVLENDIGNINRKMEKIDSKITWLQKKKENLSKKISKKYEYHKKLFPEAKEKLQTSREGN